MLFLFLKAKKFLDTRVFFKVFFQQVYKSRWGGPHQFQKCWSHFIYLVAPFPLTTRKGSKWLTHFEAYLLKLCLIFCIGIYYVKYFLVERGDSDIWESKTKNWIISCKVKWSSDKLSKFKSWLAICFKNLVYVGLFVQQICH